MSGNEYQCGECRHRFRSPEGVPLDTRSLMCPACGSIDLTMVNVERPQPPVMRAPEGAPTADWRQPRETSTT